MASNVEIVITAPGPSEIPPQAHEVIREVQRQANSFYAFSGSRPTHVVLGSREYDLLRASGHATFGIEDRQTVERVLGLRLVRSMALGPMIAVFRVF